MLPSNASICFHFSLSLMEAMPLKALTPIAKFPSNAWPITNKQNTISGGWLQPLRHWGCQNFPLPPSSTGHKSNDVFAVATRTKLGFWKKHVGNTKEKHKQKTSTESSTQAVVLLSSWNHNTKCHKPVPRHWKLSMIAFSYKAFLICCLWKLSICFRSEHLY